MSYWVYVIFERRALVPMLSPTLFGRVMGIADFLPTAWIPLLATGVAARNRDGAAG